MYYPDTLKFKIVLEPIASYQNEAGDWITPEQSAGESEILIPCRYEPNDAGRTTTSNDGQRIDFGGMVYMSNENEDISTGTSVEVFKLDKLIAAGTVKRFHRGMMNARIWV